MGAFFLVAGLFQLIEPFWIGLPGWGWHVLNGFITLVLGVLVLAQWPRSRRLADIIAYYDAKFVDLIAGGFKALA